MWFAEKTNLENNQTKYKIRQNEKTLNFQAVIELLKNNEDFVMYFNKLLCESEYESFFWEVKPIDSKRNQEDFEFVLINSNALLDVKADSSVFSKYFSDNKYATSFVNLSGESVLITPVKTSPLDDYAHIAKFCRNASVEQILAFWNLVGDEFGKAIENNAKWLSTSGLGVYWLHVRIDPTPKYINYGPYKEFK